MKAMHFILVMAFMFPAAAKAQHCPFDGATMIVIHLTDKKGNSLASGEPVVSLQEIENPLADSCMYAKGLLSIPFEKAEKALIKKYNNSWESWAVERSKGCRFLEPGYYVVVLSTAQVDCMKKEQNDYIYSKRHFVLSWRNKGELGSVPLPPGKLYGLCTNGGSWKRIEAIDIQLTD